MRVESLAVRDLDDLLVTTLPDEDRVALGEFASKNPGKRFFGPKAHRNVTIDGFVPEQIAGILQRGFKNLYVYRNDSVPEVFSLIIRDNVVEGYSKIVDDRVGHWRKDISYFVIDAILIDEFGSFHPVDITYAKASGRGCEMEYSSAKFDDRAKIIPYTIPQIAINIASRALCNNRPIQIINTSFDETTGMLLWFEVAAPNERIGWIVTTTVSVSCYGVILGWEVGGAHRLEDDYRVVYGLDEVGSQNE